VWCFLLSRYSTASEISAARSSFFNRHVSYLLVTERMHFYHRYKLRGARKVVFYGPPFHPEYYLEFVNEFPFLARNPNASSGPSRKQRPASESSSSSSAAAAAEDPGPAPLAPSEVAVHVLFSPKDKPAIERIVGLTDCQKMLDNLGVARSFTFV
jgi:U3 small nucleolar RNA-associated protein 25